MPARSAPQTDPVAALSAVQGEAIGSDFIVVHFEGLTFTCPADPQEWPAEATAAFEDGKAMSAIRALAGPEGWQKMVAKRASMRQVAELFKRVAEAAGFTSPGE